MTSERVIQAHLDRERARRNAAAAGKPDKATPQQKLVRAAETGRFEAIVAAAQPAEPPKMVTPEEREAELRRTGQWTDKWQSEKSDSPSPVQAPSEARAGRQGEGEQQDVRVAFPHLDPPPSDGGGGPELTPNEQYIAEHCRWRRRGPGDYRERVPYGRCLTEYDVFTGEPIGDGYEHSEEDDEW
ncbi:MAG: hypothetical protein J0J01_20895 [Reyranella sp.]|uniref:hypothetical protein n=1 Tax=Reyranella sp. TaxID=1929291 RepID=UPI001AD0D6AE|nr:hypothetical protein [Reyranella sp.]MBN9089374.1 hypothetical protein [Reyranella sp.]